MDLAELRVTRDASLNEPVGIDSHVSPTYEGIEA